jgi:hypothetical protein
MTDKENTEKENIIEMDFSKVLPEDFKKEESEANEDEVFEMKTFSNSKGHVIHAKIPYDVATQESDFSQAEFETVFYLMGQFEVPIEFPPHYTLEDCFENFEMLAEQRVEEIKKEAEERQRIMTPEQMQQMQQQMQQMGMGPQGFPQG